MAQLILIVAYMAGCAVLIMRRAKVLGTGAATLLGRARIVGPGVCLLLLALAAGGMFRPAATPIFLLLAVAGFVAVVWPGITEWLVALGLVALALSGLDVVRLIVPATPWHMRYPVVYGLTTTAPGWTRDLILPQLWAFLIASSWLIWRVTDDGAGGADPARGSGLRGLERRLAAFDGILAVSSPPFGPTMIVIEVPCALAAVKT